MNPVDFYKELKKYDFGPFIGVADSLFSGLFNYLESIDEYIPAANEGLALSMVAGSYLSGRKPVVMLQNAGIGNLINPQTSLNDLYGIKSLLLVGWRGNPDYSKDAPEHWLMGERTLDFLKLANVKTKILESLDDVKWANSELLNESTVALIINPGVIDKYEISDNSYYKMSRYEAIKIIANHTKNMIRFSTTAMISRELYDIDDNNKNFYTIGSMGHVGSIALGTALEKINEKIIILDGDGALLMHLGVLSTIGNIKPKNLLHVCLDNEAYSSTGLQSTTSYTTHLEKVAFDCGYINVRKTIDAISLKNTLEEFLELNGPGFILAKVNKKNFDNIRRIQLLPSEITKRFMEAIK